MTTDRTSYVARLAQADEGAALHTANLLAELLDPDRFALACYEADSGWAVEISFDDADAEDALRAGVVAGLGEAAAASLALATVAAQDWIAKSLAGLKPVEAGRFVVHGAHDRERIASHRIGIEIEAALAFGTGHHGTTRGCLLALDALLRRRTPRRILDVGTGSGVLAIAAAKALRREVVAGDIDRLAVIAARRNAAHNRCAAFVRVVPAAGVGAPTLRQGGPYDLVCANILLAPLQRLARPIGAVAGARAHVILSGLLLSQATAALSAYRNAGFVLQQSWALEGWATLLLVRGGSRIARGQRTAALRPG